MVLTFKDRNWDDRMLQVSLIDEIVKVLVTDGKGAPIIALDLEDGAREKLAALLAPSSNSDEQPPFPPQGNDISP